MKRLTIAFALIISIVALEFAARLDATLRGAERAHRLAVYQSVYLDNSEHHVYSLDEFDYQTGTRLTPGAPKHPTSTIWMFGNSALLSAGVADNQTINARIQHDLPGARVLAFGKAGENLRLEFMRLREAQPRPGDTVIFYTGVTETFSVYLAIDRQRTFNPCASFAILYCSADTYNLPRECPETFSDYRATALEALAYARAHGVALYIILQPHLYTSDLNQYERTIDPLLAEAYQRWSLQMCWAALRAVHNTIPDTLDLTHVLDADRSTGAVDWFDMTHATARGNAIIARAIYDRLTIF